MADVHAPSSFLVIGDQSLLVQCCNLLLDGGHRLTAVVSDDSRIRKWAGEKGVPCIGNVRDVLDHPAAADFDFLLSITNLRMLPDALLTKARRLAINFHDGPLPRYAGLNAPIWALMQGESHHGITWHVMTGEADTGDVLVTRAVPIEPEDTGFTLNARCYEAGLDGFVELLEQLSTSTLRPQPQDLSQRTYFGRGDRPTAAATLDWQRPAAELERLVRALDFGPYGNPLMLPKLLVDDTTLLVRAARVVADAPAAAPGTVLTMAGGRITVRCSTGALEITQAVDLRGTAVDVVAYLQARGVKTGDVLSAVAERAAAIDAALAPVARGETRWRSRLRRFEATSLPVTGRRGGTATWRTLSAADRSPAPTWITAVAVTLGRLAQTRDVSFAYMSQSAQQQPDWFSLYASSLLPIGLEIAPTDSLEEVHRRIERAVADAEETRGYLRDLPARDADLRLAPVCDDAPVRVIRVHAPNEDDGRRLAGTAALAILVPDDGATIGIVADGTRVDPETLDRLLESLAAVLAQAGSDRSRAVEDIDVVTPAHREQLARLGRADAEGSLPAPPPLCVHQAFEQQVARTPDHVAARCRGRSLTYTDLNASANRLARHLRQQNVQVGDRVGVMVDRSLEMLVALCAVQKCGAAYVPLDPQYPAGRLAYMIDDAAMRCVIVRRTRQDITAAVPQVALAEIEAQVQAHPAGNLELEVPPSALAYMIYTSGSTGRPKGVMVEHRNVLNFFVGMDHRIDATPGVWLAVTSVSFDISVLELFWTLARGFTVVLHAEGAPADPEPAEPAAGAGIPFGLFYWNVASKDRDHDTDKYRLLLESAKFADTHGFNAVWTPERHFESFGGLFPNPSVTSAALATITTNVSIRAGSCVVPLHSPIRVAEEWAVVDNLSNGRVALSVAAGWATPDFAIRPEGFAGAKQVMFESTEIVRRLWRGETVTFEGPKGPVQVRTLPRPIQPELPLWVTTAGNVQTFIEAGRLGANLLTHLLGQSIDEVAAKVRAYREARREAGHAGPGIVTLMLHTFIGPDEAKVEETVRQPLKDYLKSATFLVKAAAWQFPTFKRLSEEQEQTLDEFFDTISEDDMDALLEFAFQRYFRESGLFGTVERGLEVVEKVQSGGIDEIACLIDFGIDTDVVLDHLPYLDTVRSSAQRPAAAVDQRHSLASLLASGTVSHFQCTPSMARIVLAEPRARAALAGLRQMMVGGEALPADIAADLAGILPGRVANMYGPTETTIWSTVGEVTPPGEASSVPIGRPLAHQSVYVLDDRAAQLPPGVIGELVIGGDGVTRGYWGQTALTADRFLPDPFSGQAGARMYRTGDRGYFRPDGQIECLGRVDHQVKIRGHRVEPGEIESLLRTHDTVADAVVILREDVPGDQRLVAYLRAAPGQAPDAEALKSWLRSRLPEVMVPSAFVWLPALPLTPNGKVDRRALPAPRAAAIPPATATTTPTTAVEALVAEIWQRALDIPSCGTRDNFFDLGGHSLLIVQVLSELRQKVSKPIQMTDLFKYTTIESLARFIGGSEAPATVSQASARAARRKLALDRRTR